MASQDRGGLAGVIIVNSANRMPTDNKEKEPRRRSAGDGVASFNHPFPSVTRGHRAHRANLTCFKDQLIARNFSDVSSVLSVCSSAAGG